MIPIDRILLSDTSHRILVADLESRGNVLSEMHLAALRVLVGAMADYAAKTEQGRRAVALPTGMGKTSAVVAFILALEELNYSVPVSVATSKVEALCTLKRELLTRGVPEHRLGLKHRVAGASLPSTGDDDRLYMLVTHSRVNRGADYSLFGQHRGNDRSLMIWDETLLRSEALGIDVRTLRAAGGALPAYEQGQPVLQAAIGFLTECLVPVGAAMSELREQGDPDARGAELMLPERTETELAAYSRAVASTSLPRPFADAVRDFFEASPEPLRVLAVGSSEGLIWTRECIPHLLRNILVLDASYPIRSLVRLDESITEIETFPTSALKRFDDVRVIQLMAAGGRSSIARTSREQRQERSAVVREVAAVIGLEWATCRGILVFTFKQNGKSDPDHFGDIKAALQADGFDPETLIDTGEVDQTGKAILKAKLQGLTYGQETSLNGFEFCDVVILAGVLHRSELDIAAAMKGQLGHLSAPTPFYKVRGVVQSEVAHVALQAISRGSCRRVENGKAKAMTAYLIHRSKKLRETLEGVMPGASWEFRVPTYLKPANAEDVAGDAAAAILEFLRKVSEGTDSVACRTVAAALQVENTAAAKKAFKRGGDLIEPMGSEWAKVGASFKRSAARYGFSPQP